MAGSNGDNSSFTDNTKIILGKYIKKPPLTDSNLARPPFKYLQHLITAIIKQTGLLSGLYTDDEIASADRDKTAKAQFLQKAIDCIQHLHGKRLAAKPSKIIAGLEPEQTNYFLQAIGVALDAKQDSGEAVKRVLNGDKPDYASDFSLSPTDDELLLANGAPGSSGNSAGSNKENNHGSDKLIANGDIKKDSSGSTKHRRDSKDVKANSSSSKRRDSSSKRGESNNDTAAKRVSSKDRGAKDEKSKSSSSNRKDPSKERKSKDATDRGATSTNKARTKESDSKSKEHKSRESSKKAAESEKDKHAKRSSSRDPKEKSSRSSTSKTRNEDHKPESAGTSSKHISKKQKANQNEQALSPASTGAAPLTNGVISSPSPSQQPSEPMPHLAESPDRPSGVSHSAGPERPAGGGTELSSAEDDINRKAYSAVPRPGSAIRRPGTAMGGGRPGTAMGGGRPTTARPAPPRVRKVAPELSSPVAGVGPDAVGRENSAGNTNLQSTIITDSRPIGSGGSTKSNRKTGIEEDETDQFIIQESLIETDEIDILGGRGEMESILEDGQMQGVDADTIDAEDHGGLVRKILETKKDLETNIENQSDQQEHKDGGGVSVTVFDEKERDRARKDASKLQTSIQQLTRTSHPFGRLMDFMQEDIDGMMRELEQWRAEVRQSWGLLRERSGGSEAELDALRNKLAETDAIIRDERDAVRSIQANILENDEKIRQLMGGAAAKT